MKQIALILETNNLQGGRATPDRVAASLERLLTHLRNQTLPLTDLKEVIITHSTLAPAHQHDLSRKFADIRLRFVRVAPEAGYYDAKEAGFRHSSADIVVFGDSDCEPASEWLEKLVAPFQNENVQIAAGRTTYDSSLRGIAATTIDFMYFGSGRNSGRTLNFYANNFAIRRDLFASHSFVPIPGQYRGQCQALAFRLFREKIPIVFVPGARTVHKFPDSFRELVLLRMYRGQDTVGLAPHLARAHVPFFLQWLRYCGPVLPAIILCVRFFASVYSIGKQDMRNPGLFRMPIVLLGILLISCADFAGMLCGWFTRIFTPLPDQEQRVLSYHA